MKFNCQKGHHISIYLLLCALGIFLVFSMKPIFQSVNNTFTDTAAPQKNPKLNQEGITTSTIGKGIATYSLPPVYPAPPVAPGDPPPVAIVGDCGPSGCGTIVIADEEAICGTMPGPGGVLEDGCWVCNHSTGMWYWEINTDTPCQSYWYDFDTTCSGPCSSYSPPYTGISTGYCYVCTSSGANIGIWQKRKDGSVCANFWNSPYNCVNSDVPYETTCGCLGVPPVYGIYHEETTLTDMCWICDGSQWINSLDMLQCEAMWIDITGSCNPFVAWDDDFPYCGCVTPPPARGPDPSGTGDCWICNGTSWINETDPVVCTDFWINDSCTTSSPTGLSCADPLPSTSPGAGNCWLCTNPLENYRVAAYNATNPLYLGWGEPCDKFWKIPDYPPYLNIPGYPDDVETVCADPLSGVSHPEPGITYDSDKDQWGCWLCTSGGNFNWIYWNAGRFDNIGSDQYQACHNFWIEGQYPATIPASPVKQQRIYEYGGAGDDVGEGIVLYAGNLYIVGAEASDAPGGGSDIFVMKVNAATSVVQWKKQYGGAGIEVGKDIVTDGTHLYVTGYEDSDTAAGGDLDILVMKLDMSGNIVWSKQYGGVGADNGRAIDVDPATGEIYVTGDEASDPVTPLDDIFVMKLDPDGNMLWGTQFGGTETDTGQDIKYDDGFVYVSANEYSTSGGIHNDILLMRLDANTGAIDWFYSYGGTGYEGANSLIVEAPYIYVAGSSSSDTSIEDGGSEDICVMKLNNDGTIVWHNQYGGTGSDKANDIAYLSNSLYVTGFETSDTDAGANYATAQAGGMDLFVMKLNEADGSVIWKQQHGGTGSEIGTALTAASGYVYATGQESTDPDGGGKDILLLSLETTQPLTLGDARDIDGWGHEGVTLDSEPITTWSPTTIIMPTHGTSVSAWTAQGVDVSWADNVIGAGWLLEGTILDPELNAAPPPHEEEILWSHITPLDTTPPPPPPPPPPATDGTIWKYQYGLSNSDSYEGVSDMFITTDSIYVVGVIHTDNSVHGDKDTFVMKLNKLDASVVWVKRYGDQEAGNIFYKIKKNGNYLYLAGYTEISLGFTGWHNIAVAKLNEADGSVVWINQYGTDYISQHDAATDIEISGTGDLYVSGSLQAGAVPVDDSDPTNTTYDLFVMKLNEADGSVIWRKNYGGRSTEYGGGMELSGGYIYLAGSEVSDPDGGGDTSITAPRDAVLMKLNEADGSVVWANQYGGISYEAFEDLTVSGSYVYAFGFEYEPTGGYPSNTGRNMIIGKFDISDGSAVWVVNYGNDLSYGPYCNNPTISGSDLYCTGYSSEGNMLVMKINEADGSLGWMKRYGGSGTESANALVLSDGYLYVGGSENSDTTLGGSINDAVVMKIELAQTTNFSMALEGTPVPLGTAAGEWSLAGDPPIPLYGDAACGTAGNEECIDEWIAYGADIDPALWEHEGDAPIICGDPTGTECIQNIQWIDYGTDLLPSWNREIIDEWIVY